MNYQNLHVTTAAIPRKRLADLPCDHEVVCTPVGGWHLRKHDINGPVILAGEFNDNWLVLDVAGHVIVDGRR